MMRVTIGCSVCHKSNGMFDTQCTGDIKSARQRIKREDWQIIKLHPYYPYNELPKAIRFEGVCPKCRKEDLC